jgi:predicted DCC family thiol-disulfide oxidoreductase YuxK
VLKENLPPHLSQGDRVILFDGVCKLCNIWSKFIIRFDKHNKFKLASVQSQEGKNILQHFNYPTDVYETMLVVDESDLYVKSGAFLFVMKELGYPWKFISYFKIIPVTLRDWLYDRIASNRYTWFGKFDTCSLPTPDHKSRYLDGN